MDQDAKELVVRLGLEKHPEGGYYRETYRSGDSIAAECLPERFPGGARFLATAIYFLLEGEDFSALHRIKSDEVWHFYAGGTLLIHVLDHAGNYTRHRLGDSCSSDVTFQFVVKAGCWFGASLEKPGSFALVGCTVSPGFDFRDFDLAEREEMLRLYPGQEKLIARLTR